MSAGATKGAAAERLRVKLVKSPIGCTEPQRRTLRGLGLTRREKVVLLQDTPPIRGMIRKVIHLLEVEEV